MSSIYIYVIEIVSIKLLLYFTQFDRGSHTFSPVSDRPWDAGWHVPMTRVAPSFNIQHSTA